MLRRITRLFKREHTFFILNQNHNGYITLPGSDSYSYTSPPTPPAITMVTEEAPGVLNQ